MNKKISFFSLVILIVAGIDNMRNLPAAALFGSSLPFFFMFSAIVFLIPTALISAELSAAFSDKGGIYHWVNMAFGKRWAMAAIWLQWINTMVWYPSFLSFIAGVSAYLIDPALAENKTYLVTVILSVFWGLTWVNLKGIHTSALINNIFALIGTIFPLTLLIVLGGVWFFGGNTLQIQITSENVIPPLTQTTSWVSLIAIMASFLGMELSGVHVNDIHNPQRNFPRAVFVATLFIFVSMFLGSMSIAYVIPTKDMSLVSGVMQVFSNFFDAFHLRPLIPVMTLLIVIGSIGTTINWLISPAKGLLHAAEFGFLPPFFAKKNHAGVASNILLMQAILVSVVCLLFLLEPTVNGFYWFLTALSTELYMIMYVLMFLAAICLHYKHVSRAKSFKIPGWGVWTASLLGLIGCTATIIVSFFPPENVSVGSPMKYVYMICIGNVLTISPLLLFYWYKKRQVQ